MQSRLGSFTEAVLNQASGFFVSWAMYIWIIGPWFHYPIHYAESAWLTLIFTAVSIVRTYCWRRLVEWWMYRRSTINTNTADRRYVPDDVQ